MDLIFCDNLGHKTICPGDALVKCDRYHPALVITVNCDNVPDLVKYDDTIFDFKCSNFCDIDCV